MSPIDIAPITVDSIWTMPCAIRITSGFSGLSPSSFCAAERILASASSYRPSRLRFSASSWALASIISAARASTSGVRGAAAAASGVAKLQRSSVCAIAMGSAPARSANPSAIESPSAPAGSATSKMSSTICRAVRSPGAISRPPARGVTGNASSSSTDTPSGIVTSITGWRRVISSASPISPASWSTSCPGFSA